MDWAPHGFGSADGRNSSIIGGEGCCSTIASRSGCLARHGPGRVKSGPRARLPGLVVALASLLLNGWLLAGAGPWFGCVVSAVSPSPLSWPTGDWGLGLGLW